MHSIGVAGVVVGAHYYHDFVCIISPSFHGRRIVHIDRFGQWRSCACSGSGAMGKMVFSGVAVLGGNSRWEIGSRGVVLVWMVLGCGRLEACLLGGVLVAIVGVSVNEMLVIDCEL